MSVVPLNKKITHSQIVSLALKYNVEAPIIESFSEVEGSGIGFSDYTGRMLIQFEPAWMKRFLKGEHYDPGTWLNNGVGNQTVEWNAFHSACDTDETAAMKSTSVGMMQVMGFHYQKLGFKTVQAMWDFAEVSELNQLELGLMFIKANAALYNALKSKNWHLVAYYYNGAGYKELAARLHSTPYDVRFANAYRKFVASNSSHTNTTVNIRKGPAITFDTVCDPFRVNTAVDVLSESNGWSHVVRIATGTTGWICSKYITPAA